jgi:hypothetical protein
VQLADNSKTLSNADLFIHKNICKQSFVEGGHFEYPQFVHGHRPERLQFNHSGIE